MCLFSFLFVAIIFFKERSVLMKQITVGELREILKNFDDNDVVCIEEYDGGTSTVTSIGKASSDYEETDALVFCSDTYDKVDKLCCNACEVLWSGLEEASIDENTERSVL